MTDLKKNRSSAKKRKHCQRISLDEEVKQFLRFAEGSVGCQEGAYELRVGVRVVGEPLYQFEEGASFDHGALCVHLVLLQNNVFR